ncbi:MAG: hypothetical protein WCW68_11570 [Methanothrix sp.]
MADKYKIVVELDETTLKQLDQDKFSLYAFKGVETKNGGGQPVLWFRMNDFGPRTEISWTESYQAYWSNYKEITNDLQIGISGEKEIDLGQYFDVNDNGTSEVNGGGPVSQITIRNQGNKPRNCGLSQKALNGGFSPLCVFPLHGTNRDAIMPKLSVLLIFESQLFETSTVYMQAFGKGLLVDLTNESSHQRQVSYEINHGWDWGQKPWASIIDQGAPLDKSLITVNPNLKV